MKSRPRGLLISAPLQHTERGLQHPFKCLAMRRYIILLSFLRVIRALYNAERNDMPADLRGLGFSGLQ